MKYYDATAAADLGSVPTFDSLAYPLGEILYQNDTFDSLEDLNTNPAYISFVNKV